MTRGFTPCGSSMAATAPVVACWPEFSLDRHTYDGGWLRGLGRPTPFLDDHSTSSTGRPWHRPIRAAYARERVDWVVVLGDSLFGVLTPSERAALLNST
jgi:hypothetical protein